MKAVVITGATSGIGLEVAQQLVQAGYLVLGIGRRAQTCERARDQILKCCPKGAVFYFVADLLQQREVNRVADELVRYLAANCAGKLDVLINNAGCVRSWYTTTEEGYEQQFALNHLAGFLLTYRLLPFLQEGGRVIMTGSASHRGARIRWNDVMLKSRYNPLIAYQQSKLCNLLFARGLNDRLSPQVHAYVVDPGLVKTDIGNKQTGGLVNFVWSLRKRQGVSPAVPAQTYCYLCGQEEAPGELYYYQSRSRQFDQQVTCQNADRLFALSEQLCGIAYQKVGNER